MSTREELLAIYGALLTISSNSSVNIYTDSQSFLDSIYFILEKDNRDIRLIHKKKNIDILLNIRYIINSKNISIDFIKVKGYSRNSSNNLIDNITKIVLARNLNSF